MEEPLPKTEAGRGGVHVNLSSQIKTQQTPPQIKPSTCFVSLMVGEGGNVTRQYP